MNHEGIVSLLEAAEVEFRPLSDAEGSDNGAVVTLPGENRLKTECYLTPQSRSIRVEAFVCRAVEEAQEEVYRYLLAACRRSFGVHYTLDRSGDIYLVGQLPDSTTPDDLQNVLGQVLERADEDFNRILERGFASSIRHEWAWRLTRGESTMNLRAFAHLRPEEHELSRLAPPPGSTLASEAHQPTSDSDSDDCGMMKDMTSHDLSDSTPAAAGTLILLRHGQSEWNASNQFTGWVDVHLTEKGLGEARRGGEMIKEAGLKPSIVYTSLLRRAITTANEALNAADRHWIPVIRDWRLNERHYGALQGLNKAETKEKYGEEQFMAWRRSYDTPPPAIDADDKYAQTNEERYADLPEFPATECLLDVVKRFIPYYEEEIAPRVTRGETVLVAAHGNSLRALVKHLDQISDEDIAGLNIPTGIPLVYRIAADGTVVNPGGEYLDPEAAAAGAAAVAAQGENK